MCRNTGRDSRVCLSEVLCSTKDRVFPEEKVYGNGISDCERKGKILQLLNAPHTAPAHSPPCNQCDCLLSKEHMILKKLLPQGYQDNIWVSP